MARSRRRQRQRLWPLIIAVAVVVITAVTVIVLVNQGPSGPSAASATGPSACALAVEAASRTGPWKMITPRSLCGMLPDNTAQIRLADTAMVNAMQGVVASSGITGTASVGQYRSALTQGYQIPANAGGVYRSVSVAGLDGTFSPAAAVAALGTALDTGSPFRSVPPGPHGGAMACARVSAITEQCVWATASTLGVIQIVDTTRQLVGSHVPGNAVLIRDAVEAPA